MKKPAKNKRIYVRSNEAWYNNLEFLSNQTGIQKSDLVRKAVQEMYISHLQSMA